MLQSDKMDDRVTGDYLLSHQSSKLKENASELWENLEMFYMQLIYD